MLFTIIAKAQITNPAKKEPIEKPKVGKPPRRLAGETQAEYAKRTGGFVLGATSRTRGKFAPIPQNQRGKFAHAPVNTADAKKPKPKLKKKKK